MKVGVPHLLVTLLRQLFQNARKAEARRGTRLLRQGRYGIAAGQRKEQHAGTDADGAIGQRLFHAQRMGHAEQREQLFPRRGQGILALRCRRAGHLAMPLRRGLGSGRGGRMGDGLRWRAIVGWALLHER